MKTPAPNSTVTVSLTVPAALAARVNAAARKVGMPPALLAGHILADYAIKYALKHGRPGRGR